MKTPSIFSHLRDIFILPFTMTVIVPYLVHNPAEQFFPNSVWIKIPGFVLVAVGSTLFFSTVLLFNRVGKGTLAPWYPTQKLVVIGPYRYCRNPMITGVLCILIGESLIFRSENLLIWAFCFFLINTTYFILVEEPGLEKRFGEDYRDYKQKVPRWIPKFKPYDA